MDLQQYVKNATRTESKLEVINTNYSNLMDAMTIFVKAGNLLDMIKKNIFYGKSINPDDWEENFMSIFNITIQDTTLKSGHETLEINPRLFHALIGIATESTELIEAIVNSITTHQDIDHINVLEEIGDIGWYTAIAIDATGGNWEDVLDTNIKKLKARYPDKFTSDNAINRNTHNERKILETQEYDDSRCFQSNNDY